jgi:hypothetical protein
MSLATYLTMPKPFHDFVRGKTFAISAEFVQDSLLVD